MLLGETLAIAVDRLSKSVKVLIELPLTVTRPIQCELMSNTRKRYHDPPKLLVSWNHMKTIPPDQTLLILDP